MAPFTVIAPLAAPSINVSVPAVMLLRFAAVTAPTTVRPPVFVEEPMVMPPLVVMTPSSAPVRPRLVALSVAPAPTVMLTVLLFGLRVTKPAPELMEPPPLRFIRSAIRVTAPLPALVLTAPVNVSRFAPSFRMKPVLSVFAPTLVIVFVAPLRSTVPEETEVSVLAVIEPACETLPTVLPTIPRITLPAVGAPPLPPAALMSPPRMRALPPVSIVTLRPAPPAPPVPEPAAAPPVVVMAARVGALAEVEVRLTAPPAPAVLEPLLPPPVVVMVDRLAAPEAQVMLTAPPAPPLRFPLLPESPPLVVMCEVAAMSPLVGVVRDTAPPLAPALLPVPVPDPPLESMAPTLIEPLVALNVTAPPVAPAPPVPPARLEPPFEATEVMVMSPPEEVSDTAPPAPLALPAVVALPPFEASAPRVMPPFAALIVMAPPAVPVAALRPVVVTLPPPVMEPPLCMSTKPPVVVMVLFSVMEQPPPGQVPAE